MIVSGCRIDRRLHQQDIIDQGREAHLYQPDDSRAKRTDDRFILRQLHLPEHLAMDHVCRKLDLEHMRKPQFVQRTENLFLRRIFGELPDKDRRDQHDTGLVVEDLLEVVLLYIDGFRRTGFQTFAAVHTPTFTDGGFPLADTDRTGRALRHAVGTADTTVIVYFQCVVKLCLFHGYLSFAEK